MRRQSLLLSLVLIACGSPAEPITLPSLQFESGIVFGIATLATKAEGSQGTIVVTGVIHTIGTGFTLVGHVAANGPNALTLEIDAEDNAPGEYLPVQNFYRATLGRLTTGDYELSVTHKIRDPAPGSFTRVYHETVHVK